jgi:hypothetical protein
MYNLLKQKNQQQTTPSKKKPLFYRSPLGFKSANALVDSPVTFNRFQQQVKNDEEFARRLENSLYEDSKQFQVSVLVFLIIRLPRRLIDYCSSQKGSRNQFKKLLILTLCLNVQRCL